MSARRDPVDEHYGRLELGAAILQGLRASGKDPDRLVPEDLVLVDQFHIRGRDATLELARLAKLTAGTSVLDVGGGIGGPARTLAAEIGCQVTVLDLTEAFCRVGADLTARCGLADRVTFQHGNALSMPFPDGRFDVVWTQHSSMNIEDKPGLYREIRRVLRPGGRLAIHEIMATTGAPIHFPVPWARDASISFLCTADDMRGLIPAAGFRELAWVDGSREAIAWFRERLAAAQQGPPPPLGLHLLLGAETRPMLGNVLRNLEEDRVAVIQAVYERG
ncbi:MAG TPA: methyltransferase domain-containing protein [Candidatus Tectomicrobia bacterium]|nr:methyltransferase domain-containing protein [Candidatus Tectomicrobia bacterium]